MGRDKAGIVLAGETLLARAARTLAEVFDEVLVVGCDEDRCGTLAPGLPAQARAVPDECPGLGPVGGIASALAAASHDWVFVCACDMPLLDAHTVVALSELVARTSRVKAVAPRAGGNSHPLAAFYSRAALPAAREALAAGRLSARGLLEEIRAAYIDLDADSPIARTLTNVNTPGELAEAERQLEKGRG
jgi:molybdopterin-guanine dinucleotide biosynthesis protein A